MEHRSLAHIDHDPVIGKCRDHADSHDARKAHQIRGESAEVPGAARQHRYDIIIYQRLRKCSADDRCDGVDQDADDHEQEQIFIIMEHIADDPADQLYGRIAAGP